MKSYSTAALAAIEEGKTIITGAVEILVPGDPVRVWGGYGQITIDGEIYDPLGDHKIGIATGASIGGIAQNLTLTLSGIDPSVLTLLDANDVKGAPVAVWTLIFDSSGTQLLHAHVYRRGRVDRLPVVETPGGTATISAIVESPGRGLGRRTGRIRSDADQRLIKSNDGGMRNVSFAAEKTLYWGGKRPSNAGAAVGGSVGGGRREPGFNYALQ